MQASTTGAALHSTPLRERVERVKDSVSHLCRDSRQTLDIEREEKKERERDIHGSGKDFLIDAVD